MDLELKGKLCLVTGSSIGLEITKLLVENGAMVIVNGRSEKSTSAAIKAIHDEVGNASKAFPAIGDLSTADGVKVFLQTIEKIEAEAGRSVDALINNLGMFHSQDFAEISDEKWTEYYETNTMSGVRLCRYFLPKMLERNEFGRIIFISSECALKPLPNMLAYGVSKTSQLSLSRGLAELTKGSNNITVNSILPGPTMTKGVEDYMKTWASDNGFGEDVKTASKKYFEMHEPTSLAQRFLNPKEVAYATVFLTSPLASGINGVAQHVDGGIVRHIS